ncbi:Nuclear polyadenylated RNA binding protein [Phaffia rhodozyma]|uniref:Nuclear polyadenylated RNA binding protein n=1 Tax=Phaffia rhodozyma TaxID=264483 RepID=A0A0F7STH9_PHARH|nr:Nuclear polyadenylated RNA binding protein [Phaffia rhodozyma]
MSPAPQVTMGTSHAQELQDSIQAELAKFEYAPDDDPVMAEYITVMLANSKTQDQITAELMDLIGDQYDESFTTWLFARATNQLLAPSTTTNVEPSPAPVEAPAPVPVAKDTVIAPSEVARDDPPHSRRPPTGPANGLFARALSSSALNPVQPAPVVGQKRPAPSQGSEPSSKRRVSGGVSDSTPPSGPRKLAAGDASKNLLERLGGKEANDARQRQDSVQQKIDSITRAGGVAASAPKPLGGQVQQIPLHLQQQQQHMGLGMQGGFNPGMMNNMMMDPQAFMGNMMGGGMGMGLQEMMMVQMAQMQAMQQQMQQLAASQQSGNNNNRNNRNNANNNNNSNNNNNNNPRRTNGAAGPASQAIVPVIAKEAAPLPTKPTETDLCKFALGCTNAACTYSHPSPAATPQTQLVLSTEACEAGKNCKDQECVKSHVSPAQLGADHTGPTQVLCKFQNCTNPSCQFLHVDAAGQPTAPPALANPALAEKPKEKKGTGNGGIGDLDGVVAAPASSATTAAAIGGLDGPLTASGKLCKFKSHCTRADCKYTHPFGRTAPAPRSTTYHPYAHSTSNSKTFSNPSLTRPAGANRSVVFNANAKPFVPPVSPLSRLEQKTHISDRLVSKTESGGEKIIPGSTPAPVTPANIPAPAPTPAEAGDV